MIQKLVISGPQKYLFFKVTNWRKAVYMCKKYDTKKTYTMQVHRNWFWKSKCIYNFIITYRIICSGNGLKNRQQPSQCGFASYDSISTGIIIGNWSKRWRQIKLLNQRNNYLCIYRTQSIFFSCTAGVLVCSSRKTDLL